MIDLAMREAVRAYLREDIGRGDLTSNAVVPAGAMARGNFVCKDHGVLAGLPAAAAVFAELEPAVRFEAQAIEGQAIAPGQVLAVVRGPAHGILASERVALNLLQRACGVATAAARATAAVGPHKARILDTRKTTPGLRWLEKYAARVGGALNHRQGLDDAVLIKDNHLALAGGVAQAVAAARRALGPTVKIEVEVESLEQLAQALEAGAELIMLDNMDLEAMAQAVALTAGRARLEASGDMSLERLPQVAATGVDFISMGWLTHGARPLNLSLDLEPADIG